MPSPFPGMDPYLEEPTRWPDVHQRLITYLGDAIQPQVRPRYHARLGERLYVVQPRHTVVPDVVLIGRGAAERPSPTGLGQLAPATVLIADEPLILTIPPTEVREPFLEIVHTTGGDVVTIVEVLSPANKAPGEGQRLYRQKQQEILRSSVHLVEIDLLHRGAHTIVVPEASLSAIPPYWSLISVSRAPYRDRFEVYPVSLTQRLPRMRIPLKSPDPDVVVDLQAVFNACYDNGGYADFLDYRRPLPLSLPAEALAWVDSLLQAQGLR